MPKQNKGAGTGVKSPPRQGEKGGMGGDINKRSAHEGMPKKSKAGKGSGTMAGGESGGKHTGGTERSNKGNNPSGKGSGNR